MSTTCRSLCWQKTDPQHSVPRTLLQTVWLPIVNELAFGMYHARGLTLVLHLYLTWTWLSCTSKQ